MTSRMCGVAARSSAPKRGRSLRSGGSRLPRSSSEVETSRIGPTASASRRALGVREPLHPVPVGEVLLRAQHRDDQLVGVLEGGGRADHRPGRRADLVGLAAQLDAVEGAQVDRRRQVGLEPVHDEQPVERGRGGRVDLVDGRALRRHQLERQRLRAQAVAHVQEVVVGAGVLPQPGAVLGQRGQGGRLGVVPVERAALLVGGLARHLADVAEVAQVLRARARDLLRALLPLPVDLDDDEAERGEEEHAGREEAAAAVGPAAHRRDEHDRAEAAEHRDGVHQHAAGALALLQLRRRLQDDLAARHLRLVEPLAAPQCRAHASPVASPDEVATMIGAPLRVAHCDYSPAEKRSPDAREGGIVSDVVDARLRRRDHRPQHPRPGRGARPRRPRRRDRGRRRPRVRQAGQSEGAGAVPGIPLLQTALGERLNAAVPLGEAGVQPGDVLVATSGVHRPRRTTLLDAAKNAPESPALASMIATVARARRRARRLVRRSRGRGDRPHRRGRDPARVRAGRRAPGRPAHAPAGRRRSGLRRGRRLRRPLRAGRPPAARDPRRGRDRRRRRGRHRPRARRRAATRPARCGSPAA